MSGVSYTGELMQCSFFLENGASLANEFLSAGVCQGGIDQNCTTVAVQEGNVYWNTICQ